MEDMSLGGPSKTIVVEPLRVPREQPRPARTAPPPAAPPAPAAPPEREPAPA